MTAKRDLASENAESEELIIADSPRVFCPVDVLRGRRNGTLLIVMLERLAKPPAGSGLVRRIRPERCGQSEELIQMAAITRTQCSWQPVLPKVCEPRQRMERAPEGPLS
jgi:hypothetical protein